MIEIITPNFSQNKTFKVAIILLTTAIFIVLLEAPSTFRHYENPPILLYFAFSFVTSLLFFSTSQKFIIVEKIIYSVLIGTAALLASAVLSETILGKLYGFDDNFSMVKSQKFLQNLVFYVFTFT